jgi:hypothetical protein
MSLKLDERRSVKSHERRSSERKVLLNVWKGERQTGGKGFDYEFGFFSNLLYSL